MQLKQTGLHWREIDGEIVALEGGTSTYVVANRSGALLWQILVNGASREELIDRLVNTYGIDGELAANDVDTFLAELRSRDLLTE